jgi:spore germination protein
MSLKISKFAKIIVSIIIAFAVLAGANIYINNKYKSDLETTQTITQEEKEVIYEAISNEITPSEEELKQESEIEEPVELSAWIAYWDFYGALNSYKANSARFNSLSPTWYYLQADGSLGLKNTARNNELINLCKTNSTKLYPTISNSSADSLSTVLNDMSLLNTHINNIVNEVNTNNYDGIDIDYETIKSTDKAAFSGFVRLLSEKLHLNNKKLTIAILWKNDLDSIIDQFSDSRAAQDWEEIGKYVDEFRIMGYEYTHSYSYAGPIAPTDWLEGILEYAVKKVDSEKIVLGLPLYAYEWSEGAKGAKALVWNDVNNIKNNNQLSITNNQMNGNYFEKELKYKAGDVTKIIWYQDSEVTERRIELAKEYGVTRFVFWRLGGEDTKIWETKF